MSTIEFKNESGLDFVDISSEEYRTYKYADGSEYRIDAPQRLNVSKAGGHRVFDGAGLSHYITKGWRALQWKAREGQPHFVK